MRTAARAATARGEAALREASGLLGPDLIGDSAFGRVLHAARGLPGGHMAEVLELRLGDRASDIDLSRVWLPGAFDRLAREVRRRADFAPLTGLLDAVGRLGARPSVIWLERDAGRDASPTPSVFLAPPPPYHTREGVRLVQVLHAAGLVDAGARRAAEGILQHLPEGAHPRQIGVMTGRCPAALRLVIALRERADLVPLVGSAPDRHATAHGLVALAEGIAGPRRLHLDLTGEGDGPGPCIGLEIGTVSADPARTEATLWRLAERGVASAAKARALTAAAAPRSLGDACDALPRGFRLSHFKLSAAVGTVPEAKVYGMIAPQLGMMPATV